MEKHKQEIIYRITKSFLKSIQQIINSSVKLQHPSRAYVLSVGGNKKVKRLINDLYNNATIFLNRKKEKINESGLPISV